MRLIRLDIILSTVEAEFWSFWEWVRATKSALRRYFGEDPYSLARVFYYALDLCQGRRRFDRCVEDYLNHAVHYYEARIPPPHERDEEEAP
jgi:pyruvate/oxaloacetate carboxyltransferase